MNENEIGGIVVDCAVIVPMRLGPGLLESGYAPVLSYELQNKGLLIQKQVPIPITYEWQTGMIALFFSATLRASV